MPYLWYPETWQLSKSICKYSQMICNPTIFCFSTLFERGKCVLLFVCFVICALAKFVSKHLWKIGNLNVYFQWIVVSLSYFRLVSIDDRLPYWRPMRHICLDWETHTQIEMNLWKIKTEKEPMLINLIATNINTIFL